VSDSNEAGGRSIGSIEDLREHASEFLRSYQHGTDDAPYFVARDIARLPAPYAIAVTAAICQELNQYERERFTKLLLTVAKGEYRSVFDRASE
jgi:hypothetical protein